MKKISNADIVQFMAHARKLVPNFSVYDNKSQSYLMNLIDGIVYVFSPRFLELYITTIINKVWFPNKVIRNNPAGSLEILGHELVHAYDAQRLTFPIFAALYLSSGFLSILSFIGIGIFLSAWAFLPFVALGIHAIVTLFTFKYRHITGFPFLILSSLITLFMVILTKGMDSLWLIIPFTLAAPFPAPGRTWAELRGFTMTILLEGYIYGIHNNIEGKIREFTGPSYYFMMPFESYVREKLKSNEIELIAGMWNDPVFAHTREFFEKLKFEKRFLEKSHE